MINGVNYDLICQKLKEYFENHNELENYQLIYLLNSLIGGIFYVD